MSDPLPPMAGLCTLPALKAAALSALPADAGDSFDAQILRIGRAVAAIFDRTTNRRFARVVASKHYAPGDAASFTLPAYPLEGVSSVATFTFGDYLDGGAPNWITVPAGGLPFILEPRAGIVRFFSAFGNGFDKVRVTYTGGYWLDGTLNSDGTLATRPAGSSRLPDDVLQAFILQCAEQFNAENILGIGAVTNEDGEMIRSTAGDGLLPMVKTILRNYARLA